MAVRPIRQCPGRSATDTEQNWHHLLVAKNLGICSRCYQLYLAQTPFVANFGHEHDNSGARRFCDFDVPGSHSILRRATEQNDFRIFSDYWLKRAQIPRCKGAGVGVATADNLSWHQLNDPNLVGTFGACSACYEDYVVPSRFSTHFAETPIKQPEDTTFECDMAWEFCQKLLAGSGDWSEIANWLLYRKNLPRCTAIAETDGASRRWHKLCSREFDSLLSCEACYYDSIHNSVASDHFQPTPFVLPPSSAVLCMIGGNVPLRVVLHEALFRKDWSIFDRAAQVFIRSPPCRKEGTQSAVWYSLIPASAEIDICGVCYASFFEGLGAGNMLQRKHIPPGEVRLCNMSISAPHVFTIYSRLDIALDQGNPEIFTNFLRQIAEVPQCPGGDPVAGRRWYTNDMLSCCPSCWLTAPIQGTKLSGCFTVERLVSTPLKCDFYSARVRGLWSIACIENNLAGFTETMKKRLEIWQQTYPLIQQNLGVMRMNMQRQTVLYTSSIMNTGANNIANAAMAAGGLQGHWGSSANGYGYNTYAGAMGALQFNQALSMNGINGGPMMIIEQLEGQWKSVE